MSYPHSTNGQRFPQRAVRVVELARQQAPIKTPAHISAEAMRIVDRRAPPPPSPRSWWQRFQDRMDADVLVEALVWGWVFLLCALLIVGTLLAVRAGWIS